MKCSPFFTSWLKSYRHCKHLTLQYRSTENHFHDTLYIHTEEM